MVEYLELEHFCHECNLVRDVEEMDSELTCKSCGGFFIEKRQILPSTGIESPPSPNIPEATIRPRNIRAFNLISFPVMLFSPSASFSESEGDRENFNQLLHNLFVQHQNKGTPPVAKLIIENLKDNKRTILNAVDTCTCPVCQDELSIGDKVIDLKCNHSFCEDCIIPWLEKHNSCPLCRMEMETDDPEYEKNRVSGVESQPNSSLENNNNNSS